MFQQSMNQSISLDPNRDHYKNLHTLVLQHLWGPHYIKSQDNDKLHTQISLDKIFLITAVYTFQYILLIGTRIFVHTKVPIKKRLQ